MGVNVPVAETVDRRTGEVLPPRTSGQRTGSRIDPLGIIKGVDIFQAKDSKAWATTENDAGKGAKKVRPSEINHGNIAPSVESLGVTCAYAEHRTVLTLAGLRRLQFGSSAKNDAGRALIATIGMLAAVEQDVQGYALRSRCDLVCEGAAPWELVHANGTTTAIEFTRETARKTYEAAYEEAKQAGFNFQSLKLEPQDKLVKIVQDSRNLALAGKGGDQGDE